MAEVGRVKTTTDTDGVPLRFSALIALLCLAGGYAWGRADGKRATPERLKAQAWAQYLEAAPAPTERN